MLFSAGALVPLLPWLFMSGGGAIGISALATAVAALVVGGWVSHSAGRPALRGAIRQLLIVSRPPRSPTGSASSSTRP